MIINQTLAVGIAEIAYIPTIASIASIASIAPIAAIAVVASIAEVAEIAKIAFIAEIASIAEIAPIAEVASIASIAEIAEFAAIAEIAEIAAIAAMREVALVAKIYFSNNPLAKEGILNKTLNYKRYNMKDQPEVEALTLDEFIDTYSQAELDHMLQNTVLKMPAVKKLSDIVGQLEKVKAEFEKLGPVEQMIALVLNPKPFPTHIVFEWKLEGELHRKVKLSFSELKTILENGHNEPQS